MKLDSFLSRSRSLTLLAGSIGELVPGLKWWYGVPPPLFPLITPIMMALGLALLLASYFGPAKKGRSGRLTQGEAAKGVSLGRILLIISVAILVVYVLALHLTTIAPPGHPEERLQIGFGRFTFSLTNEGKAWLERHPDQTITDWMMNKALFREGGPEVLWETWSIQLASLLLIVTFLLSFALWVGGWSIIARHIPKELPNTPPR